MKIYFPPKGKEEQYFNVFTNLFNVWHSVCALSHNIQLLGNSSVHSFGRMRIQKANNVQYSCKNSFYLTNSLKRHTLGDCGREKVRLGDKNGNMETSQEVAEKHKPYWWLGCSSRGNEKWSDSGDISKVDPVGFADRIDQEVIE